MFRTNMACLNLVILLSAIILVIDCYPDCTFDAITRTTICKSENSDYVLQKGLVSDNNHTKTISLRRCRITDIEPRSFNDLTGLKNLDLSDNKITKLTVGVFDGAPALTHLNLSYNRMDELPLGLFDQTKNLELLDLKGNGLTVLQRGIFDQLTRLGHLDLSSNAFKGRELDQYLFDNNPSVTFLDFSGNDMSESSDKLLRAFRIMDFLNLSGCSLTEIPKFATAANLRSMRHLMLINNLITSIHNPATFHNLINLQILNFAGNSIEFLNKDVFRRLKKLRSVVLSDNKIRDIPVELFKDLENLGNLDLSRNLLQFVNVNSFRGTSLRNLNLSNNKFSYLSDNFILELANSRASLSKFYFNGNPWQCACLRDILKEAKVRRVEYNSGKYDGKHVVCVTTKEFSCKRHRNFNDVYVEMYENLAK